MKFDFNNRQRHEPNSLYDFPDLDLLAERSNDTRYVEEEKLKRKEEKHIIRVVFRPIEK